MNQSILIIEDEKEIADTLTYAFSSENFSPVWLTNAKDGLDYLNDHNNQPALCVFDVGLPDLNGFELLKRLRQSGNSNCDVPVVFLTARAEEIDRIVGLELGADDYVCKPFSPREVVTRAKVILKRTNFQQTTHNADDTVEEKTTNPFLHKVEQRVISYNDHNLDLTRAEYALMSVFLEQPSRVFSRRQLIEQIWSSNHPSDDRAIDTHIKTLRAKLKTSNPHKEFIVTHRGFGYSLELT